MRQRVEVSAVNPGGNATEAFAVLRELDRHVVAGDVIRSLRVERLQDGSRISHWDVTFQKGILHWSQREELDEVERTMRFAQTEGDADVLEGAWRITDVEQGCRIHFSCDFDLGIPTLSRFVDPLATRILRETVTEQLREIFGPQLVFEDGRDRRAQLA